MYCSQTTVMATTRYLPLVFCVFLLASVFVLVKGRQLNSGNEVRSEEGCYVNHQFYEVGESWTHPGMCAKSTCAKGGSYYTVPCPLVAFLPGSSCTFSEEDLSKPYPLCCPQPICP